MIEILPGLFGLYGFGWIYSGNVSAGVILLVGGLLWGAFAIFLAIITGTFACICTIPVNLGLITLSSVMLNGHIKNHPELFGA